MVMAKFSTRPALWRTVLPALGLAAALILGGYLIFEYGRYQAGFDKIATELARRQFVERIQELETKNGELREQIALLRTAREVDKEGYRKVEDNLLDLQAKILKQQEELAFYSSIVNPADSKSGLRIQDFQVLQGPQESLFRLRLVLVQSKKHDRRVSGVVKLLVSGARDGRPVSYELSELIPEGEQEEEAKLAYSFRYFQDFEHDVMLPEGFRPDRVNIELQPNRGSKTIKQSFTWAVKKG